MTTQPAELTAAKLRAVASDLRAAAQAYHALYFKSMQSANIETQNFCTAVQILCDDLEAQPSVEDLQKLLRAGVEALAQDICAGSPNVFSAIANARRILTEVAQASEAL